MDRTAVDGFLVDANGAGKDGFEDEDEGAGKDGTLLSAADQNQHQEEIMECIDQSGQTPSSSTLDQLYKGGTRGGTGIFGDGDDGPIVVNAATHNLGNDTYATDVTYVTADWIETNGYKLFCSGTITFNAGGGGIRNEGDDAAADVPGIPGGQGSMLTGTSGGAGNVAGGSAAGALTDAIGGSGGAGGAGDGGAGGAGGLAPAPAAADGGFRDALALRHMAVFGTGGLTPLESGAGGGGGAGDGGANKGGGGGGGGGPVFVAAHRIEWAGGLISAKGGDGGDGAGGNSGGGGGGGGGQVGILYRTTDDDAKLVTSTDTSGGALGAATGSGGVGITGGTGKLITLAM